MTLSATANSGLAVSFTSTTPSVCTVSGMTAAFGTAGTCTIDASLASNNTYSAASQVAQSFTVNPAIGPTTTIYIVGEAITSSPDATDQTRPPRNGSLSPAAQPPPRRLCPCPAA